ncbi:hypothetical protein GJ496_003347 [Pomphorhynchus laevis]|nr:hypothetical protein GJ496_003347 [Pomphorhynchus laevis]
MLHRSSISNKSNNISLNPIPLHHECRNCGHACSPEKSGVCINAKYPMINKNQIYRQPVSIDNVRWFVKYTKYSPKTFSNQATDIVHVWNEEFEGIDHRSHHGLYKIESCSHLPLNPVGRTGLKGLGILKYYGPNHCVHLLITRARIVEYVASVGVYMSEEASIEALAKENQHGKLVLVHNTLLEVDESPINGCLRLINQLCLSSSSGSKEQAIIEIKQWILKDSVTIYSGYVDDCRNTDNAWIETYFIHLHATCSRYTDLLNKEVDFEASMLSWIDLKHTRDSLNDNGVVYSISDSKFLLDKISESIDKLPK